MSDSDDDAYGPALPPGKLNLGKSAGMTDNSPHTNSPQGNKTVLRHNFSRQFLDRLGDNSPTLLETVHRHFCFTCSL